MNRTYEIVFPSKFDARAEWEAEERGLLDCVNIRIDGRLSYSACFFTPNRLAVELKLAVEAGETCVAQPGLVVIPIITAAAIREAVDFLVHSGYFEQIRPIEVDQHHAP